MADESPSGRFACTPIVAWALIISTLATLALLASGRQYLTFGTETDFVGGFVGQAEALLAGRPLRLGYHPPLYPLVLALVKVVQRDWLTTGLLISWVSCAVTLAAQYRFFTLILSREAGIGGVVALVTSTVFTTYAMMATSDLLFLAVWSASLWLAAAAWPTASPTRWAACGLLVGLAVLTRTNGVTLIALSILPWISQPGFPSRRRWICSAAWMLAMAAPLAIWFVAARHTGSDLLPRSNHANLAMTYFGSGDRISGESRIAAERQFEGLLDVVTHDPVHMASQYARDLASLLPRMLSSGSVTWLVAVLAVAGLPLRCFRARRVLVFVAATALQVAFVNLKTFEPRYWLFLLPWLGALAGAGVSEALARLRPLPVRAAATTMLLVAVLVSGTLSLQSSRARVHGNDAELRWLVSTVRSSLPDRATVIARKMHLGQYTDVEMRGFPDVQTVADLRDALLALDREPLFLYYGSVERWARSALGDLADPELAPAWLEPVGVSPGPESWVLYEVKLPRAERSGTASAAAHKAGRKIAKR